MSTIPVLQGPPLNVMLNPFAFAPRSLRLGTSQAKLREASRSLNWWVPLAMNEILRHYVPQNDIDQ